MSVIHNTHRPESTFKKKSKSICFFDVCKSVAMGEYITRHVGTNKNCADLNTKLLYGGKCKFHVSNLLYNIYDYL